jgi:hypothetical protein
VQCQQPTLNQTQTLNQKQLFLHKVIEDEVAGLASLLLLIWKIKYQTPMLQNHIFLAKQSSTKPSTAIPFKRLPLGFYTRKTH